MGPIIYTLVIVGGPYDGVPGLFWLATDAAEGEQEGMKLPPLIHVGRCNGQGQCIDDPAQCRIMHRGRAHVAYWTPQEKFRPARCYAYRLESAWHNLEGDTAGERTSEGRARYVDPRVAPLGPRAGKLRAVERIPAGATVLVSDGKVTRKKELV